MSSSGGQSQKNRETEYLKEFGKSLKGLRVNVLSKSLRIFAYETDVPCATLSRIENGMRIPNIITLKKLATGFDLEVGEFIKEVEKNLPTELKQFDI